MTTFILLAIIAGETFWLYRLGAFNGWTGWAMAVAASMAAFAERVETLIATLVRGWLA